MFQNNISQPAYIKVTFWGTEFFKCVKTGAKVTLGSSIAWPVLNIVSQEEASAISTAMTWVNVLLFLVVLLTIPSFLAIGSLPATWVFVSTIVILAHLPLYSGQLPPVIHLLLLELLRVVRLDFVFNYGGGAGRSE